ncbi:MAG TPA: acyltransferase [Syntrophomonadaceae bacterium]|nr:acyltransferase [Syntrophomonadaceae bacterium]
MKVLTKIRGMFWTIYLRLRGSQVGRNLVILGPLDILLRDGARWRSIIIGDNVSLGGKTYIRLRKNGRLILEDGVRTGTENWLVSANNAELKVSKGAVLGNYSIFNGGHGLTIGEKCIFAAFVYINSSDHGLNKDAYIQDQGFVGAPVAIGSDVWLGGQVFIGKGVSIGDGAVVGAGSVVTKNIAPYNIAAGIPARVISERK